MLKEVFAMNVVNGAAEITIINNEMNKIFEY